MDLSIRTDEYGGDDQTWLGSAHGTDTGRPITLDSSAFTEGTHYPDGFLPSGTPLAKISATGLYGPYTAGADEVQTLTVDATSGNFTLTFQGETTANIAENAAAGTVQSALEALSNVEPGDITVTGSAGGPWTLTFGGQYANEDVVQINGTDVTLSGGGDSIAVVTATPGGGVTSGLEVFAGHLLTPIKVPSDTTVDVQGVLLEHGIVVEANLPTAIDAVAKAAVAGRLIYR